MTSLSELNDIKDVKQIEDEHRVEWSHKATKELLKIYDEKCDMLDTGIINTQKKLWELTSKALIKKGHYYTGAQCENKWKALKRAYRTKLERIEKFGSIKRSCPFESEITEILSKRPNESITRSYSSKIISIKKENDLFENINLNEPPGFAKDAGIKREYDNTNKIIFLEDNQGESLSQEGLLEQNQPSYTIIQQDTDQAQNFLLVEEVADLKRVIIKHSRINAQVLRETSKVQEKILNCLEQATDTQNKVLEMEEKRIRQQDEVINQMKIQNNLLKCLVEKFS